MTTMWNKAMFWLGLGPDDEYDEAYDAYEPDERRERAPAQGPPAALPEPPEAQGGAVRPLPRERQAPPEPPAAPPTARRSGVVRSLAPTASNAKPVAVAPVSFNDAQELADRYMSAAPVVMDLDGVDRELSRRLVDFASGLCYGLRGQMEKVSTSVYLLTPANVEVSAEERRKLRDGA